MKHFIIDGNNLIGKVPSINSLKKKGDDAGTREALAFMLERHFHKKKVKVTLHFDGFKNLPVNVSGMKIIYSDNLTADDMIRNEIENSKNPRNIILITSDIPLSDFGRKCSCTVIKSEDFYKTIKEETQNKNEEQIITELQKQNKEFVELFSKKKNNKS